MFGVDQRRARTAKCCCMPASAAKVTLHTSQRMRRGPSRAEACATAAIAAAAALY